ncbi:acyl-CoA dehydrogenase family protein [Desulfotomaculum copahuensis]|uniref:Acyl-CoA dehydrogenase n=1 Tax=Desulfotomaculum copahuensis TaxID=1838280 RepID=A0A1B7LCV4_9FIRM|nr:acyl-CoA dehydrogenase family protein [Desulfotomaculum copahuensis]OAT80758.1 acyl-CoA dehydrogenase [Desulfotomaculum copahuensis]
MLQKGGNFLLEALNAADVFTPEDISDEHRMIAGTVADFALNELAPRVEELEHQPAGLMRELLVKAGELGLLSADVPEEYGGSDLGKLASIIITENIVAGGSFALGHGAHTGIGSLPIVLFGNEEQKKRYLPGLASGDLIAAYALTEPNAGSDALSARTKAVLSADGKHYILNGEKMFITNAGFADVFITYAKVDGDKFTAFIVDRNTPGFSLGAEENKMGIKGSSTRSLIFEDAKVPVENVLGEIGRGHVIAFNILNIGRLKLGAGCSGSAKMAIGLAAKYALQRQQFNLPIAKFGLIRQKLARMITEAYAAESVIYRLAGMIEESMEDKATGAEIAAAIEEYAIECSIAKVFGSEVLDYIVDELVQIHGGYGYIQEYPAERLYRDSRINRIFEGTNEINRLIIPATLVRRAMKGQLALLPAAKALAGEVLNLRAAAPEEDGRPLAEERTMLAMAKKLFLLVGGQAVEKYMDKLAREEEIIGILADLAIQIYAMESAVLRALKAWEAGPAGAQMKLDLARAFVFDHYPQLEKWAKEAICFLFDGDMLRTQLSIVKRLCKHQPADLIGLRRQIAARLLEAEKYVV